MTEKLKIKIPYIETSAKTGENIEYLFLDLCRMLLIREGFTPPEISKLGEQMPELSPEEAEETHIPAGAGTSVEENIPETPAPSPLIDIELTERVSNLEEKVKNLEEILKKLMNALKISIE